jgi:undecaprenyl-diphosphatase
MPHSIQRTLWAERDRRWAQRVHRASQYRALLAVLRGVSWLGDGVFWYVIIAALGLAGGTEGRDVAAQMLLAGTANLTLYLWVKGKIGRPRPFVKCPDIRACGRALDQFSFPSGHALHATTFTIILSAYYPPTVWVLVPVAVLMALSRVALGLHYPSDVAAGAAIGAATASLLLALY